MAISILVIAILATVLVGLAMAGGFQGIQELASGIENRITGGSYTDAINRYFKAIEEDDQEAYLSLSLVDFIDFSQSPFSLTDEESRHIIKMHMPRLIVEDGFKDKLIYTITDVYEYSKDKMNVMKGHLLDGFISDTVQQIVKLNVHLIYDVRGGIVSEHTGEIYAVKIQNRWYIHIIEDFLSDMRPTQRGRIRYGPRDLNWEPSSQRRADGRDITSDFVDPNFLSAVR